MVNDMKRVLWNLFLFTPIVIMVALIAGSMLWLLIDTIMMFENPLLAGALIVLGIWTFVSMLILDG